MKITHPIKSLVTLATLCGLVFVAGIIAFRAQASEWDKRTVITVDQPIQVMDTYLDPGTYVFRLLDSASDRHIVQIFNADQTHLINTVLAIPNYRLEPTGGSRFLFWETPQGSVKAMRAWFYPGDSFGQEFPYPKQLRQIAVAVALPPQPEPQPAAPEPPAVALNEPVPAEPAPQTLTEPAAQEEQPVEIAQNNPPSPPATPEPAQPLPQVLPKTASPYPLFGLAGLFAFGLFGLVRRFA